VKTEIVRQILDIASYRSPTTHTSWIIRLKNVAEVDVDVVLWRPTQNYVLNPMLESNKVKLPIINVEDAIHDNQYGLGDFYLFESSEAKMLSLADDAIKHGDGVAFLGWKPHWMNAIYKLKHPGNPKLIWDGTSTVNTVVCLDHVNP